MIGVRAYLFSPDAADYVASEQPAWQSGWKALPVSPSWPMAHASLAWDSGSAE